jgi:CheY-like chemotaxis protein
MAKKVLMIDDDPNTVKYLSVVLEENGYEVAAAYDGREGLEKIKEIHPDLVVLDVMMPKKTGFTLFRQLRKEEEFKDLPILMLTGVAGVLEDYDDEADAAGTTLRPFDSLRENLRSMIQKMRSEGLIKPDMFMDKPVEPDEFIERVEKLLNA